MFMAKMKSWNTLAMKEVEVAEAVVVEAALVVAVDCIDCIRGRSDGRVIGGEGGKGRVLQ